LDAVERSFGFIERAEARRAELDALAEAAKARLEEKRS
jgi:hypothetical protein